jgi:outer membrane protein TolC
VALVLAATPASADTAANTAEDAEAGPARELALSAAIEVAVRQNPSLAKAAVDSAIAEARYLQSLGIDDWVFTGTGSVSFVEKSEQTDDFFGAEKSYGASLSLIKSLRTGGVFGVTATGGTSDAIVCTGDGLDLACNPGTLRSASVSFSVEHSLLRGFGSDVARASQKQAEIARDAVALSEQIDALETVRQIVTAYWEVAYAARDIEIRKGALELAQEQLRITRAGIDAGAIAPTESLAIEQGIAVREEAIVLAEVNLSERSLELRRLVGLEVGPGEIDIAATEPLVINDRDRDLDLDAAMARAIERNPSLALIANSGESAKVDVIVTQNGLKPILDLSVRGGPTATAPGVADTLELLGKFDAYSVTASVTYTQELGSRAAEGADAAARHQIRRIKIDLAEAEREISVSVVRAVNLVRTARKRIEVTQKSIALAEKNLDTEKKRFEAGDATNFDILQRQDEIQQAQLSNTRAVADYLGALALVDSLTGDLLDRHGIKLEGENR